MSVKFVSARSALVLLDHLLSILVVTPLVVVYWRGLWMLLDALVLPESPIVSGWVTFICGQLLMLWFHLMQESLDVLGKSNPHLFMVVSRTYTQVSVALNQNMKEYVSVGGDSGVRPDISSEKKGISTHTTSIP